MEENETNAQVLKTLGGTALGPFGGLVVCVVLDLVVWGIIGVFRFWGTHSMEGPGFPMETFRSQALGSFVIAGAVGVLAGAVLGAYQSFAKN